MSTLKREGEGEMKREVRLERGKKEKNEMFSDKFHGRGEGVVVQLTLYVRLYMVCVARRSLCAKKQKDGGVGRETGFESNKGVLNRERSRVGGMRGEASITSL